MVARSAKLWMKRGSYSYESSIKGSKESSKMTNIKQDKKWVGQFSKNQPSNLMVNIRPIWMRRETKRETLDGRRVSHVQS